MVGTLRILRGIDWLNGRVWAIRELVLCDCGIKVHMKIIKSDDVSNEFILKIIPSLISVLIL